MTKLVAVLAIGRGSTELGTFGSIVMLVLAALFGTLSVARRTRVGAAFSHGSGETRPINPAARGILFAVAVVLLVAGVRGLIH